MIHEQAKCYTNAGSTTTASASTSKKTSQQSSGQVLLKGKDGHTVAVATLMEGDTIHGHELQKSYLKVAVNELIQPGAEVWFPPFDDESELHEGSIVEWPEGSITSAKQISPLHTRTRRKK